MSLLRIFPKTAVEEHVLTEGLSLIRYIEPSTGKPYAAAVIKADDAVAQRLVTAYNLVEQRLVCEILIAICIEEEVITLYRVEKL